MKQIEYQASIITPMFLYGADTRKAELRAPSFKGEMRFWWRAVQRSNDLEKLKNTEARLFGTSDQTIGRSPFRLQVIADNISTQVHPMLPHRTRGPKLNIQCLLGNFRILITSRSGDTYSKMGKLLELSAILGGVGKRSRRGFGCYALHMKTEEPDFRKHITRLLNDLDERNNNYQIDQIGGSPGICPKNPVITNFHYPDIKEIIVKKTTKDFHTLITDVIGPKTSNYCQQYHAGDIGSGDPRLASPVYISYYHYDQSRYIIITLLNSNKNTTIQKQFRDEVLAYV